LGHRATSGRPIGIPSTNLSALVLACALSAGCASDPRVDEETADLVVVRGFIESGELYRWPSCPGPQDFLEVVNCVPGSRSTVRFLVEEPIVGAVRRKHLPITFGYAPHWPEVNVGASSRYLALVLTDGRRYEMHGVAAVLETEAGGWAIPATFDEIIEFPCSTVDQELERLSFRSPRPRELVSSLRMNAREIDEVDDEGLFALEDGYLYAHAGVPVERARSAYAGKSASQVAGECH
jgi:hypothetical protein